MTIALKRKAKVASLSPAKLATKLIASRQLVFFASVKHCFFKVSACSPERKVHKMFRITLKSQGLTNEFVRVLSQLFVRQPFVAVVGGGEHILDGSSVRRDCLS